MKQLTSIYVMQHKLWTASY